MAEYLCEDKAIDERNYEFDHGKYCAENPDMTFADDDTKGARKSGLVGIINSN